METSVMKQPSLSRRSVLLGTAGLAAARRASAASASGNITVMGYFGIFQDNYTTAVLAPFMRAFPDIKVTFRPIRGSAEATALLRTQRGRPSTDVAIMDIAVAADNARDGLFAPLDPAMVPNLEQLAAWGRPAGNLGAALTQDQLVLLSNPRTLHKPLRDWMDLAGPSLADRVGMPIGDVRGTVLLALLDREAGVDYKKTVDPAIASLKRIAPNVQTYEPQPDIYTAIRSGLIDAGIGWNARGQLNVDEAGGAFAATVPQAGSAPQINAINLVANAPNAAAAQIFINYALGAEAQLAFAKALYYGPTNRTVQLPDALALRIFGDAQIRARQMPLDWAWFAAHNNALIQRIRREVIAG
jgi:putative spermidine/putrescine transport system substrate-binding protein